MNYHRVTVENINSKKKTILFQTKKKLFLYKKKKTKMQIKLNNNRFQHELFSLHLKKKYNSKINLRKVHSSAFMLWCIPDKGRCLFIFWIWMCDRCTLWYRLCIRTGLPGTDPFVSLGITGLNEKSTEQIMSSDCYCATKKPKVSPKRDLISPSLYI